MVDDSLFGRALNGISSKCVSFMVLLHFRSFLRQAVRWTFSMSPNKKAAGHRSVKLYGELYTQKDIQVGS